MESCNALLKLNLELSKKLNVGLSLRAYAATKKYLHGSSIHTDMLIILLVQFLLIMRMDLFVL